MCVTDSFFSSNDKSLNGRNTGLVPGKRSFEALHVVLSCVTFLLLSVHSLTALGEHEGVLSFDQSVYGGARQNWSVSTARNGQIYFANHTGLLAFDGTNWELNSLPNETILRSVEVSRDSIIYTGGYEELGFWKTDKYGKLNYTSLTPIAEKYFLDNIEFWNIAVQDDYVYFQAFPRIFCYHADSIISIDFSGHIYVMNKVNDKVLVAVRDKGIFELKDGKFTPFIEDDKLNGKNIKFLLPHKKNQILIGTATHGIFLWDGHELNSWNEQWTNYFIQNELNRACILDNDKIAIGTLVDGISVFNPDGDRLMHANTQKGLLSNTILGVETDEWNNIWLALDVGIGFLTENENQGFVIEKLPGTGAIYSTAIFNDKLYLGTNQGLFAKDIEIDSPDITLVPESQDQIWNLKIFDNQLLVGHNQGTYVLNGEKWLQLSSESGAFNFVQDPFHPNLLLQSTYNSLIVFEKTENGIKFRNRITGFVDLIRYIEFDHFGNLWASHMHRDIYKLTIDDDRRTILGIKEYGKDIFHKDFGIHVFQVENRVVFTTGEQLFTYDDLSDTILAYGSLNTALDEYAKAHRIIEAPNHHYWFISKEKIGLFYIFQDSVKQIREFPTSLFNNPMLVEGFENLLPLSEYAAILCLQNGIAYLDASVSNPTENLIKNYAPAIREIQLSNNRDKTFLLPLDTADVKIRHTFNNVSFRVSFPLLSELPVSYQYYLQGLQLEWSEKTNTPEFNFERLPKGSYQLLVKAVDLWGNESKTYTFPFEVKPPLTASRAAIFFYIILMISALLIFRSWGIRQTRKKEQMQSEAREKELIRLRNDKLRSEVQHKSKELASSTMSIIKKNEFLLDLKNIINRQKTELGSRYPDKYYNYLNNKIDENISSQDDWKIFENNFERAHEQFFNKMKEQYPDLTSSDLQLCAYLRMNLSSKEIAPLLGISVRGVENHRYRLRKKMNLEHDVSLTDTILSI